MDKDLDRIWAEANHISDRIVAVLNEESDMGISKGQLLIGVLLSLIAVLGTAPPECTWPHPLVALKELIAEVIRFHVESGTEEDGI